MLHSLEQINHGPAGTGTRLGPLVQQFTAIVGRREFPCVYTALPFITGEIYFALVPTGADPPAPAVVRALRELCTVISAQPDALGVVFVEQAGNPTISDDFLLANRIVHAVMAAEEQARPAGAPRLPDDPAWELRLDGVGLFLNFSTPRHLARRSRNVGDCFTIVAQERRSFERHNRGASAVRARIRRRLAAYDDVPPHPSLGAFGHPDNREILQYFLGEGMQPLDPSGGCPRG